MTNPDLLLSFEIHNGLPHARWAKVSKRVATIADANAQEAAWRSAAETWLTNLAEALSKSVIVFVSKRVLLLGSPEAEPLTSFAERTILHVDRLLDGIGSVERRGPHVIVAFDNIRRFYDYVDYFHTESGEYGGAAGMFVDRGYPHIVVGPGELWSRRSTIAHELTHDYLSSHELPLWLEEGLAQLIEHHAVSTSSFVLDREQQQRHQALWSVSGLSPFWSGEAFSMADESQELAYQLALVLVRSIISDAEKQVAEFVRQAHYSDAGDGAAQQVLGHSLADYVGAFLGPGKWTPQCCGT